MKLLLAIILCMITGLVITDALGAIPARYVPPPLRHPADAAKHRFVIVQPGDTLSAIARKHGVPLADLRAYNSIKGDAIQAGQRLRLPIK
jgi:LysM repeat protein